MLENQEQAFSAGLKFNKVQQPLTYYRASIISRLGTQQGMTATHQLKSQGQALSAGLKYNKHHSCSHPEEPKKGIVSSSKNNKV